MSLDRPTNTELLEAVREFLETRVMESTSGALQFNTRVAINVLKILERESINGEQASSRAVGRIQSLLSVDETDAQKLSDMLAEAIENGEIEWDKPELLSHLRQTTLDKLSIDNPRYSAFLEETGK